MLDKSLLLAIDSNSSMYSVNRPHIEKLAGAHSAMEHLIAKLKFIARHYMYGDERTGTSFTGRV